MRTGLPKTEKRFVMLPISVAQDIRLAAEEEGCPVGQLIRKILVRWLIAREVETEAK